MKTPSPTIQLIVRVSDGSFESSLQLPIKSTSEQRDQFAKMWIGAMATAFENCHAERYAAGLRAELDAQGGNKA